MIVPFFVFWHPKMESDKRPVSTRTNATTDQLLLKDEQPELSAAPQELK